MSNLTPWTYRPLTPRPFGAAFERLFQEMDQMRQEVFSGASNLSELYKTEDGWILKVPVPGFTKEQVHLTLSKNHVSIEAEKETEKGEGQLVRGGLPTQLSYREQIPGAIDLVAAKAKLEDGILTVKLKAVSKTPGTEVQIE